MAWSATPWRRWLTSAGRSFERSLFARIGPRCRPVELRFIVPKVPDRLAASLPRSGVLGRDEGCALGTAAMTDGQLLEQFVRRQDSAAFETLVRRHGPMVLRVCQRLLRDGPDADDAFQATFIVLVRKAQSIIKLESVASWLYGVAYRVALRAKVRGDRRLARERQIDEGSVPGHDGGAALEAGVAELRPVLDEELNRLPEKYRAPVVLCYLEGKTNEEAAQYLQWPTGTVK